jgi:Xaa-Pro aminopeptidase
MPTQYREFNEEEIKDIFSYHAPTAEQREAYDKINNAFIECAKVLAATVPEGPGRDVAMRGLSEARMKANHAISLEGKF